jgi:adenosylmethionine---8-amino-7-oxononanoate aminotransferase
VALFPESSLGRVFFSDDGSTGIEAALRVADQYSRLRRSRKHQFIALRSGYHGDTAGAASQGAAGMRLWPSGTLRAVREWCSRTDTLLIVDEVMTGFGRTGRMFATEHEGVIPDMMILGKGLTGGYLPLAITLISEKLFCAFNGSVAEGKALAYGHSYTGNALGCAAAKASLGVFENEAVLEALQPKIRYLSSALASLKGLPSINEVRQCGFIARIETAPAEMAAAVCIQERRHGLLTRPIRNVVVLMPPLCITRAQLNKAVEALRASITEVSRSSNGFARTNVEEITA